MATKVFKFGGSLLKDITGFEQIYKIIKLYSACATDKDNLIIVVSAFGKTTSNLLKAVTTAETSSYEDAVSIANEVIKYHITIANTLIKDSEKNPECKIFIQEQQKKLINYIKGVSLTKELSPRTKDLILSIGELLASNIVSKYLAEYFNKVIHFDIIPVIITDENHGTATPNLVLTEKNINASLLPLFKHCKIIVTQGFIGSSANGEITTMGYESSNLTATILAGMTKADEFVIWTDVEGIRQYDPKLDPNSKPALINKIDYDFAEYLGCKGLKLIYPKMIKLLKQFNLDVVYKSGLNPTGEYTTISKETDIEHNLPIMINNDHLITYYNSNTVNKFNSDCLPPLTYFLYYENNTILISPDDHLFVTSNDVPIYIEEDLLKSLSYKRIKMRAILLIDFDYYNFTKIIQKIEAKSINQILNIHSNHQRRTINILYKETEENNDLIKCFIDNYPSL